MSMLDFSREDLERLFKVADEMQSHNKGQIALMKDKVMASLFFQPSTRTRLSIETAMLRLGGLVMGFADASVSKASVGESYHDIIRMADAYSNVIAVRHGVDGHARFAADIAEAPVINAGDGWNEHPTQAMTDLYTIAKEFGHLDGLHIVILMDLFRNRATTSLIHGLSMYDNVQVSLISPSPLREEVEDYARSKGMQMQYMRGLKSVIRDVDVVYVGRIIKERFEDPQEYERVKGTYLVDLKAIGGCKDSMIILDPLPRVDELSVELDSNRHSRYFQEAANGIPVRMALLALLFGAR